MSESNSAEVYVSSAKKLRTSLPKFIIFLGLAYVIWLLGTTFLIPTGKGDFIGAIEAARLDSLLILTVVVIFIIASFLEICKFADACAGLTASYIAYKEEKIDDIRLRKVRRTFKTTAYIIPSTVTFLIFNNILQKINPMISIVIPIVIVIWVVLAAIMMAFVLGLEIEEAAKTFAERFEKKAKTKIKEESKSS